MDDARPEGGAGVSAYVDIETIRAAMPRLSVSHIYKLASIHKWRKVRVGKSVRYRWEDVSATLAAKTRE